LHSPDFVVVIIVSFVFDPVPPPHSEQPQQSPRSISVLVDDDDNDIPNDAASSAAIDMKLSYSS
jgi:hypothetical protein